VIRERLKVTGEELVNVATHGAGLLASLALMPVLIILAVRRGDPLVAIGATVFALTLILAYAASTVYHATPHSRRRDDWPTRRDHWRRMDQAAVYLLIAGTYTPFALGVLRGRLGYALLATIWIAALIGIVIKVGFRIEAPTIETITYLAMGWLVVVAVGPLVERIGWAGMAWLAAGGIAYTIGTIFLVCQNRIRFGHCAWHVAVLGGSACHVMAVLNYGLTLPR
jgi:hemolysin III